MPVTFCEDPVDILLVVCTARVCLQQAVHIMAASVLQISSVAGDVFAGSVYGLHGQHIEHDTATVYVVKDCV